MREYIKNVSVGHERKNELISEWVSEWVSVTERERDGDRGM